MKIRALVQSSEWLNRAGVRIRYRRIVPRLESLGTRLRIDVIDNLENRWLIDDDVVILSKCVDARALLAANFLRDRGVVVGVDMFDDYFSPNVSPCHGHREFLREVAPAVDFFLCSTKRMQEVANEFAPYKPSHVLNDPFDTLDQPLLARRLQEKAARARDERRIDVLWFGNGDNPIFPVGLPDLAAYSDQLQPLTRSGFEVRLKVLTNLRALHSGNLALLRTIGIPVELQEWSQEREVEAMGEALVSFLPVNHQNFSIAKSLNRGISALTGGTQILSAGYRLYAPIGDFLYDQADRLLADLVADKLLLRPETISALDTCMVGLANPENEAARLLGFLKSVSASAKPTPNTVSNDTAPPQAMLHGRRTPFAAIAYGRERGIPSIGTPFCNARRKFDLLFDFSPVSDEVEIRVAQAGASMISPDWHSRLKDSPTLDPDYPYVIDLPENAAGAALKALRAHMIATRAGQMVHYAGTMAAIEVLVQKLLPRTEIVHSELESPLMGMAHLQSQCRYAEPEPGHG